jgi:hypothetical protein
MWATYRKREIRVDCDVSRTIPIELKKTDIPLNADNMTIEAEQIGDKVVKVSFIEYEGRCKKMSRIEVKESELDDIIKKKDSLVSVQLTMF